MWKLLYPSILRPLSLRSGSLPRCPGRLRSSITLPPLLEESFSIKGKTAVLDQNGDHSYEKLTKLSSKLSNQLISAAGCLENERVAFITPNDASYVVSQWATWISGGICVPLCKTHPPDELSYVLENSKPKVVISTPEYSVMMEELAKCNGAQLVTMPTNFMEDNVENTDVLEIHSTPHGGALILYTSGTTGRPKGVLWSHRALKQQIDMMIKAWEWSKDDNILHVLPLHHVHGVINALACPLTIGATVVMKKKFYADQVWEHLLDKVNDSPSISVFMAVPTIYAKLLQYFDENMAHDVEATQEKCEKIRLMVSGSAALPVPVFEKWKSVTSHTLLERYGMTEIGMALTNSYRGSRDSGLVGLPFPGVEAKIIDEESKTIAVANSEKIQKQEFEGQGELLIKGPIFECYWQNPKATRDSLTDDGWFLTGDTATVVKERLKIVGRTSVDIIKSGGYKIGALDIERHLLEHDNIAEVAVLGVPDDIWGQRVGAVVVLKDPSKQFNLAGLKEFCASKLAPYCTPTLSVTVKEIPKNAMGKVNKKNLVRLF